MFISIRISILLFIHRSFIQEQFMSLELLLVITCLSKQIMLLVLHLVMSHLSHVCLLNFHFPKFLTHEKYYELKQDLLKQHSPPDLEQLLMPNQQLLQPNLLNHPRKSKFAIRLLFRRTFLYFNIVEQTTFPTGKFYFSKDAGLHYNKHYFATISKPKFAPPCKFITRKNFALTFFHVQMCVNRNAEH